MKLPSPPPTYSQADQSAVRAELAKNDRRVVKTGQDVFLVNDERLFQTFEASVTAHAGGGQASAKALSAAISHVGTVATAADSVVLPPAKAGLQRTLINRGANACQVFGASPDTINGVATATGVSHAASTVKTYYCPVDGQWFV